MNWAIIGSGNGLSSVRRQTITWTNAGLLSLGPLGTRFSESEFYPLHSRKCIWKSRLPKWPPFCPGGDELVQDCRNSSVCSLITKVSMHLISKVHLILETWQIYFLNQCTDLMPTGPLRRKFGANVIRIQISFLSWKHDRTDIQWQDIKDRAPVITSNISRTLVGNKIVDNSDVVGASPVGTAPTTSSSST